jgi:8-oxo-dGTP pyrophosphatase MutT (NUDIX family)
LNGTYPIGYVLDHVVAELIHVPDEVKGPMELNHSQKTLSLVQLPSESERTAKLAGLADYWRQQQTFKLLKGWRDELWPVYGRNGELLFSMERAAIGLLGTMRYGVHLTAYVVEPSAPHGILIWVPKRAADKSTFPGMLDNTVAGGLMTGEDPFECIIREADEEASLSQEVVRTNAQEIGTITYIYVTDEKHVGQADLIYPECQWIYDLKLPAGVTPQPKDGEVEGFELCDVNQVKKDLADGKFKDNCAVVMLDFFIRHGILSDGNEPQLVTIQQRMHRELPFPGPHQEGWRGI